MKVHQVWDRGTEGSVKWAALIAEEESSTDPFKYLFIARAVNRETGKTAETTYRPDYKPGIFDIADVLEFEDAVEKVIKEVT